MPKTKLKPKNRKHSKIESHADSWLSMSISHGSIEINCSITKNWWDLLSKSYTSLRINFHSISKYLSKSNEKSDSFPFMLILHQPLKIEENRGLWTIDFSPVVHAAINELMKYFKNVWNFNPLSRILSFSRNKHEFRYGTHDLILVNILALGFWEMNQLQLNWK